jgi:hypothetical protein
MGQRAGMSPEQRLRLSRVVLKGHTMLKRGEGPGLTSWSLLVIASTSAGSWLTAARHDFSGGWLSLACVVSALGVIGDSERPPEALNRQSADVRECSRMHPERGGNVADARAD